MKKEERTIERAIPKIPITKARDITLNDEQDAAYRKLCELADSGKAHGVLLHGVTGSGKTSVMLKLIDKMVEYALLANAERNENVFSYSSTILTARGGTKGAKGTKM